MTWGGAKLAWGRVPDRVKAALAVAVLVVGVLALAYCSGRSDGARKVENRDLKAEAKLQGKVTAATDKAADQQRADETRIRNQEEDAHAAIHAAPDGAPGPAALAHNCERLRRAGQVDPRCPARR